MSVNLQGRHLASDRVMQLLASTGEIGPAAGVFAGALLAYLLTAPRSIASNDSAELTTAVVRFGIPHPPGYPLYILLGRAFSVVPVGDVGFRLNLMSATFGAVAAVVVYAIVLELTQRRSSALVAALSLAFSYHFWGESLVAEVYTLDAALAAGMIYCLCRWHRTHTGAFLFTAFFLLGLSFAHRTTSLLFVPPIVAWGLASGSFKQPTAWLKAIVFVLPGLALYLLLPIRYLAHPGYMWNAGYDLRGHPVFVDLTTRSGFIWYVTCKVFQPFAFGFGPKQVAGQTFAYLGWLWRESAGVGAILGLLGLVRAWRQHRAFFQLSVGAFLLQAWFFINYAVPDKDQMFLGTYVIWSIWIGLGAIELLELVDRGHLRSLAMPVAQALVVALPLALLVTNFSSLDFSSDKKIRDDAERLFAVAPEETLVIGSWGDIASLQYFQTEENTRPDLTLVGQWALTDQGLQRLIDANIDQRPILVLDNVPSLRNTFVFIAIDKWFRLERFGSQRRY